ESGGSTAGPPDNSRNVGPMTIIIRSRPNPLSLTRSEIDGFNHPTRSQIRVKRDSGIKHGNRDTSARVTFALSLVGSNRSEVRIFIECSKRISRRRGNSDLRIQSHVFCQPAVENLLDLTTRETCCITFYRWQEYSAYLGSNGRIEILGYANNHRYSIVVCWISRDELKFFSEYQGDLTAVALNGDARPCRQPWSRECQRNDQSEDA